MDRVCCGHDAVCSDSKDLPKITISDKVLKDRTYEMEPLSIKNKSVKYLLCVVDVFTKYAKVKTLKDKKGKTVLNAFIEIVNKSNRKQNKLWFVQGRHFYNKLMQEWLDNTDILMYSTHNEEKSVITERFPKILKAKIYKKMTAIFSKSYLLDLNKLVDEYNNTHHHSIINSDYSFLNENIESNPKAPKFKVNEKVRITKYKNIFTRKSYTENWSREIFIIDCVLESNQNNPWAYIIKDLNGEKTKGSFYEKELLQSIL